MADGLAAEEYRIGRQERDKSLEIAVRHALGKRLLGGDYLLDGCRRGRLGRVRIQRRGLVLSRGAGRFCVRMRTGGTAADQAGRKRCRREQFAIGHL